MGLYREAYLSCQVLKEAVLDLTALSVGTISQRAASIRMEFWRTINLYHLCSYVVADKVRARGGALEAPPCIAPGPRWLPLP